MKMSDDSQAAVAIQWLSKSRTQLGRDIEDAKRKADRLKSDIKSMEDRYAAMTTLIMSTTSVYEKGSKQD